MRAVADSYVQAGSDVILTNTLCANRFMLTAHGLASRVAELAEAGARISRDAAAGKNVKVFASMGPTGKCKYRAASIWTRASASAMN